MSDAAARCLPVAAPDPGASVWEEEGLGPIAPLINGMTMPPNGGCVDIFCGAKTSKIM